MRLLALFALLAPPAYAQHHAHLPPVDAASSPAGASSKRLPPPSAPATHRAYGYLTWWRDDLTTVPWDALTDLALFSVEASATGHLGDLSRWDLAQDAVAMASPYQVRVHLCVTQFDPDVLGPLLGSPAARERLVQLLAEQVHLTGAHGVNVDFERLPADRRLAMVDFVRDLAAAVPDVVVAIPAVDWSNAWDLPTLAQHADLFLMGYDYHYATVSKTGPNDPLYADADVSPWALDRSVQTYLDQGVPPGRLILGLPLYGYTWPLAPGAPDTPGAPTAGRGSSVYWDEARALGAVHTIRWEPQTRSPWVAVDDTQTWFPNLRSAEERVVYAVDEQLAGVGFWALNYDGQDPALWRMVQDHTRQQDPSSEGDAEADEPGPGTSGRLVLRVGEPLIAHPGDVVVLSAALEGADDVQWRWTQQHGPSVQLTRDQSARPRFVVPAPGAYAFEATPTVGDTPHQSATSWVVAVSRRGLPDRGCALAPTGSTPGGALGVGLALSGLLLARRRRGSRGDAR